MGIENHIKGLTSSLLIFGLLVSGLLVLLISVGAPASGSGISGKPIEPNPGTWDWADGTTWGTNLRLENTYIGEAWFGAGADGSKEQSPSPPSGYLVGFIDNTGTEDSLLTFASLRGISPGGGASDNWQVILTKYGAGASSTATISSTMENADTAFVPQDYSVVLENGAQKINLRKENGIITDIGPKYMILYVDNAVNVIISPSENRATRGGNVTFTVTVKNTGRYTDTYNLTATDTLGFGISFSPSSLTIAAGISATATLTVTVGDGIDNITVTASGVYASDSASCTAIGIARGVNVLIQPKENTTLPGGNVTFTVTVTNTGTAPDNYDLTVENTRPWPWELDNTVVGPLSHNASENVTLTVTIPKGTSYGTLDNITVTATSRTDNAIENSDSCGAYAASPGVRVSILPLSQDNFPGHTLSYTVTITNISVGVDNYTLDNSDTLSWGLVLSDNFVGPLDPGASDNHVTLTVTIPEGTPYCTWDNITVTARSQENENVSDNASCLGHAASPGVRVSILPLSQDNFPGHTLSYTVTITNISVGVDNYTLDNSDTLSWGLVLSDNFVGPLDPGASGNVTLTVTIPEGTPNCTRDNITVTARSQENENVRDNASCIAHAVTGTPVLVSPENGASTPDTTPTFTWYVGWGADNHRIEVDNDPDFSSPVDNHTLGATTNTWTKPAPGYALGTYYWRVWAISSVGENCSENTWNFTVTAPEKPVLVSPENGVSTSPTPTFTWQVGAGADNHRIEVDNDLDFSSPVDNHTLGATDNTWTKPAPGGYTLGTYYWRVWAISSAGESCSENTWSFTVTAPGKPVLASPENGISIPDTTPTFTWLIGAGATYHRIEVDNDLDFSSPADNHLLNDTDNTWTKPVPGYALGTYYWRVWAINSAGESCSENTWNFTVTAPGKPVLASPENGASTSNTTPTFTWRVGAGATYHRIEVDNDNNWANGVVDNVVVAAPNNTWTKTGDGYALGTYYWRVWAVSSAGENCSENTWSFTVTAPGKPVLASPENGASTSNTTPTFTWRVGAGATYHRIEVDNEFPFAGALIDNVVVASPNDNTWTKPFGYYIASDSLIRRSTPEVSTNSDGYTKVKTWTSTVSGTLRIKFDLHVNVGGAGAFCRIYKNGTPIGAEHLTSSSSYVTFTEDLGGWSVGDNIELWAHIAEPLDTAYIRNLQICGSGYLGYLAGTYYWRVWAISSAGENCSENTWSFTVTAPGKPVLASPENGTSTSNTTPTFTWRVGAGATYHRIEVGNDPNFLSPIDNVVRGATDNTWTKTGNGYAAGIHYWRVWAINSAGESCSENTWSFTVATRVGVSISISPDSQENQRGGTLTYTATVWNTGNFVDNYTLTVNDNAGLYPSWGPTLDNYRFDNVPPGENRVTTLRVAVSWYSPPGTRDNMTIRATSAENANVWAENSCIAYSPVEDVYPHSVLVTISLDYISRLRGRAIDYQVMAKNIGWKNSTYMLENQGDNSSWPLSISPTLLENIPPGENRIATLTVIVPLAAAPCTQDKITVQATSVEDASTRNSTSCVAHSAVVAMGVTISPPENSALKGRTLEYTVTLKNQSTDLALRDNYTLRFTDNAGWGSNMSFPENRIENVLTGENKSVKFRVTIPDNAVPGTQDNITVTARSDVDNAVENSASCVARSGALALKVSITPENQENIRGAPLSYTVKITNMGTVKDNYTLTVWDNTGQYPSWAPTLGNSLLKDVLSGESKTTTLRVTVSWYSPPGTRDNIIIRATSTENANVWAENSCIAYSKLAENVCPIDDAYVNGDAPNTNYGDVGGLEVGVPYIGASPRRAFLKFDLRLPVGSTIDSAQLYLFDDTKNQYHNPKVQCRVVNNDGWSEDMITWNNKPEDMEVLDSQIINSANKWYSWRVTDFVKNQFENENDQIVSLCMISSGEHNYDWASFSSKEGTNPPRLEVVYHGVNQHSVAVTISPNYISEIRRISYSATVQNVGWENSSYEFFYIRDNFGWPLALDSYQSGNIRPGESTTTTLMVTIPYGTAPSTRDEITVKVRYIENVNVIGYTTCIADSTLPIISISPAENNAPRGTTLTYTVRVTNPSTIPENFVLSVRDNAGLYPSWGPTLDNYRFDNVPPGGNSVTTLRVAVSWYSPPGTRDNMTVVIALAADENVRVENSCIAYSLDSMKIPPIDDSYVLEDVSDSNYGTYALLGAGRGAVWQQSKTRSFLRFYLAIPGASTIDSAQLYLYSTGQIGSPQVQCRVVENIITTINETINKNNNWNEDVITWNNQPARGWVLDTRQILGKAWYTWSVTDFVKNQFQNENDRIASLCIAKASEEVESENWANFYSKESSSSDSPYLLIFYRVSSHSPLVTISPSEWSWRDNVSYTVTVQNVGWENSSYMLENVGTLGWPIALDNYQFDNMRPGESRTTTLRVMIPENVTAGTRDEIIVKATCVEDTGVIGSAICMASAAVISRRVGVSISSPDGRPYAKPGMSTTFTVRVTNTGNIEDTYDLTVRDNSGWGLTLSPTVLTSLTGGVSGTAALTVMIPDNLTWGVYDSIYVRATSRVDNAISNEGWCEAHTTSFYRRVGVSISPDNKSGLPGATLDFTVTVKNTGDVRDNFLLTVSDNAVPSWSPTLSTWVWLENGASGNLVLRVRVPNNATGGMEDNIHVIAQSKYDNKIRDNDSCIAQVVRRGVRVGISPAKGNAGPGQNATFTVTVTNTGGAADNYILTGRDNAGWSLSLSPSTLSLAAGASGTSTLTVAIPSGAENNAQDSVTVTARSLIDNTVENSASCVAQSVAPLEYGVHVSISPEDSAGLPGATLDFTVTITNTGNIDDTYDLTVSSDHGWGLRLDAPTVAILAGESTTVTVSVTVPSTAGEGDSTVTTVTATSEGDPAKSDTAMCTATCAPPSRAIVPIAVGGVVIGGGLAAIAALLKKGIIRLPSLRLRFMRSRMRPKF